MEYVLRCNDIYFDLTPYEIKKLAYDFARKIKIKYLKSWDEHGLAGREWFFFFMDRHKNLALRTPEATSLARLKAFNKENVQQFFNMFGREFDKIGNDDTRVWNMDETGFTTVNRGDRVISRRGVRQVGRVTSQERGTLVTMVLAVCANGNYIAPFFVFPRVHMRKSLLDMAPSGSIGAATPSGWMQQEQFVKFMEHFLDKANCSKDRPAILILDNHDSHLSVDALDLASENGLTISIPPHCSHKMQPLDVSVFALLKAAFNSQCEAWMKNHAGRALEIQHIPTIVDGALDIAVTHANIKAGFRRCGIIPFIDGIFKDSDYVSFELSPSESFPTDPESERTIEVLMEEPAAYEEISTSEPSTTASHSTSHAGLDDTLTEIGPLQFAAPRKKSNRGRKPMKSAVLTSSPKRAELRVRAEKRVAHRKKKEEQQQKEKNRFCSTKQQQQEEENWFCSTGKKHSLKAHNKTKMCNQFFIN